MSALALSLVLSAAVLHASWNGLVKSATDRALVIAAVALMHAVGGAILILIAEPPVVSSWPQIFASTVIHYVYYVLLFQAYRLGDLSQVYPISRGLAPALVSLGAYLVIGEELTTRGMIGLALISCGIGLLALQRGAIKADPRAVGVAILLGITIAGYSVVDGIGVRKSGSPLGYMGWLFLLESPVALAILLHRQSKAIALDGRTFRLGLVGGLFAVTAYGLVLYAKTTAPLGAVSAVRESSVIIAALIGVVLFGERPWRGRLLSACVVVSGILTLAITN